MSGRDAALELRGLQAQIDRRLVVDLEGLEVAPGEVVALLGPNGAGKSTTLALAALLRRPSAGEVWLDGRRVDHLRGRALLEARRQIACVFQEPLLLDRSVAFNVELGLALRWVGRRQRRERARPWLERLGIDGLTDRRASELSGGEAQRTSLARALVLEPRLLLLDEPFAGLDDVTRRQLLTEVGQLIGEGGAAALLVTHNRAEAQALADRVAVMLEGRLDQVGPAAEVLEAPATAEVAAFLGYDNRLRATLRGAALQIGSGLELTPARRPEAEEVWVMIRPEDLLVPAPTELEGERFEARIGRTVPEGVGTRLSLEVGGVTLQSLAVTREVRRLGLTTGEVVTVGLEPARALVYPVDGGGRG